MNSKRCNKCNILKDNIEANFEARSENGYLRGTCRRCRNSRKRNPETMRLKGIRYREKNREKIKSYLRSYTQRPETREKDRKRCKLRRELKAKSKKPQKPKIVNLIKVSKPKILSPKAKSLKPSPIKTRAPFNGICSKCEVFSESYNHRKTICDPCYYKVKRAKDSRNSKRRLKEDPSYKMRIYTSNAIRRALRRQNGSKLGESTMKYLPYSMEEFIQSIESQWEPWMDWDSYGSPKKGEKKWQIDHITPQSKLPFKSMSDPNFQKCWSLENMRPLEAFENMRKLDSPTQ